MKDKVTVTVFLYVPEELGREARRGRGGCAQITEDTEEAVLKRAYDYWMRRCPEGRCFVARGDGPSITGDTLKSLLKENL